MGVPNLPSPHWFAYDFQVSPSQTDYSGYVWHGSYLRWLEEARIAALREIGVDYATLVREGCELPVVHLDLNYRRSLSLGQTAVVKTCLRDRQRVRMRWEQVIYLADVPTCILEAQVTLVPLSMANGRILRRLPNRLAQALDQISIF
jgi:acyl-CoA thioester hydrolase